MALLRPPLVVRAVLLERHLLSLPLAPVAPAVAHPKLLPGEWPAPVRVRPRASLPVAPAVPAVALPQLLPGAPMAPVCARPLVVFSRDPETGALLPPPPPHVQLGAQVDWVSLPTFKFLSMTILMLMAVGSTAVVFAMKHLALR